MNWLDIGIAIALVIAVWHGIALGLVRQAGSTIGLVGGLFLGAFIETKVAHLAHAPATRAGVALGVLWGSAVIFWSLGEWIGALAKRRLQHWHFDGIDEALGAVIGAGTVLAIIWLGAAGVGSLPLPTLQQQVHRSRIVATVTQHLPPAPDVIARIGHIINPNGFPQVFTGLEPSIDPNAPLPDMGELSAAVQADQASVVKIEGRGCGGIVEGSGFVARNDLVLTNAHVVAGVKQPQVLDGSGLHDATTIWFDPNLDVAVLHVANLHDTPLHIRTQQVTNGTAAAVMGYPGGGNLTVGPARILETLDATGRNIYNQGNTVRTVYSIKATIRSGNSGGPLIAKNGDVIGLVFARSTQYDTAGYALAMQAVQSALNASANRTAAVDTGACAL